jgi:hypothetical protein
VNLEMIGTDRKNKPAAYRGRNAGLSLQSLRENKKTELAIRIKFGSTRLIAAVQETVSAG